MAKKVRGAMLMTQESDQNTKVIVKMGKLMERERQREIILIRESLPMVRKKD